MAELWSIGVVMEVTFWLVKPNLTYRNRGTEEYPHFSKSFFDEVCKAFLKGDWRSRIGNL
jgi:hypothetical protein